MDRPDELNIRLVPHSMDNEFPVKYRILPLKLVRDCAVIEILEFNWFLQQLAPA